MHSLKVLISTLLLWTSCQLWLQSTCIQQSQLRSGFFVRMLVEALELIVTWFLGHIAMHSIRCSLVTDVPWSLWTLPWTPQKWLNGSMCIWGVDSGGSMNHEWVSDAASCCRFWSSLLESTVAHCVGWLVILWFLTDCWSGDIFRWDWDDLCVLHASSNGFKDSSF